jgi:hypothetical protein
LAIRTGAEASGLCGAENRVGGGAFTLGYAVSRKNIFHIARNALNAGVVEETGCTISITCDAGTARVKPITERTCAGSVAHGSVRRYWVAGVCRNPAVVGLVPTWKNVELSLIPVPKFDVPHAPVICINTGSHIDIDFERAGSCNLDPN